jgi:hypothetical protein
LNFEFEDLTVLVARGGYFFCVTLITPKITTANSVSKLITSDTAMLSPPVSGVCRRSSRSPLALLDTKYSILDLVYQAVFPIFRAIF